MKKVFKSFLILVCLIVGLSFLSSTKSEAKVDNKKDDLIIVRTQENGHTYISIYTDAGIFICKDIEL